jgi:hypothetical protein
MRKVLIVAAALMIATPVFAGEATMHALVDLLRQDIRTERVSIIEEVMEFTPQEADAFWPVYKKYEAALDKVNDERWQVIKDYAAVYGDTSDADAQRLMKKMLELNTKLAGVRKDYFRKFSAAVPAKRAAQFMQLDRQLELLVELQVSSQIPMIE